MKMTTRYLLIVALIFSAPAIQAIDLEPTALDKEFTKLQIEYSSSAAIELDQSDEFGDAAGGADEFKPKSPGKAFVLSLLVPGLGQWYYGSRVKPFIFLGAEAASWALYIKWHGEGEDITAEFEAFADENWSEATYTAYLDSIYGVTDDEDVPPGTREVSHNLPDEKVQQYYEMIGKYDQFSWGWADAYLVTADGDTLYGKDHEWQEPVRTTPETTPVSAMREFYETRRDDANNKFDNANKMIVVAMANRLISAFEAYFVTKSINDDHRQRMDGEFSRVKVRATLKSYSQAFDTPFLNVSVKF